MSTKQYLEENRWFVTASKLKTFLKNPEEYKVAYVDEVLIDDDNESESFKIGKAIDYLLSFGRDKFLETYFEDEWYTIAELAQKLAESECPTDDQWNIIDMETYQALEKAYNKEKKHTLMKMYYWDYWAKIRLTASQVSRVQGMYAEAMRQVEAFDLHGKYETQVEITAKFEWLPIKGTLDRLKFVDWDGCEYTSNEIMSLKKEHWSQWEEIVKEQKIQWVIRDWKSSSRFNKFEYDMRNTFDYVTSMAFYWILVRVKFGVPSNVHLDVLESVPNHWSIPYLLSWVELYKRAVGQTDGRIKKWLKALIKCYAEDKWDPIKPLTWEPVSIWEMQDSKYYQYLPSAKWKKCITPDDEAQYQY